MANLQHHVAARACINLPPARRLLIVAVLLPAIVAGSNYALIELLPRDWLRTLFFPSLVLSTAVLSWCAGHYLHPAWLRCLVFAWCLVLLDLLTIDACLGGPLPQELAYVLIAAQSGILVIWSVLASVTWQRRLPVALVAGSIIIAFAGNWVLEEWFVLVALAVLITMLVCGGLRWCGFALQRFDFGSPDPLQEDALGVRQFGIGHMLIWSAAIAPLLVVARGFDFLMFRTLGAQSVFPAAIISLSLASINLVAIWAILGSGLWPIRIAILPLVPILLAIGLNVYCNAIPRRRWGIWPDTAISDMLWEMQGRWTFWLFLSASLLAALLLFLRASGYRLVRNRT
jgi:hypothetical protein